MSNISRNLDRRRARILADFLPDRCTIYPFKRVRNEEGAFTDDVGEPLEYDGSIYIPCRLDFTRYYRMGDVFGQETTVNTYTLYLPYDMQITGDMRIYIGEQRYEVREVFSQDSWSVTTKLIVAVMDPEVI